MKEDNYIFILESIGFSAKDSSLNISKEIRYPIHLVLFSYITINMRGERTMVIASRHNPQNELSSTLSILMNIIPSNIDESSKLVERLISALLLVLYIEYRIGKSMGWEFHISYEEKVSIKTYSKRINSAVVQNSYIQIVIEEYESYSLINKEKYYLEDLLLKDNRFFEEIAGMIHSI